MDNILTETEMRLALAFHPQIRTAFYQVNKPTDIEYEMKDGDYEKFEIIAQAQHEKDRRPQPTPEGLREAIACAMCGINECKRQPTKHEYSMCALYLTDADKILPLFSSQIEEAVRNYGVQLSDWLMNHYLVKTGDHYRITHDEMDCIKAGKKPPGTTMSEDIRQALKER